MAKEKPERKMGPDAWEIPIPEGAEFGGSPPGVYLSMCSEEPKETLSGKGDPQTEFVFILKDPEHPDQMDREVRFWVSRKPKSWWVMTSTLEALEVPYEIDKANRVFRFNPMDCVGKMCKTVWEEQTFEGRTRSRMTKVIGPEEIVEGLEGPEGSEDSGLPF